ncbi:MAG: DNA repair protein RecN, partial [Myxococcota bacterium]
ARVELEEAARAVGRAARGVRADPERLAEVEERVHLLRRLVRKHGSVEGALAHREAARRELAALRELDVEALEARLADAEGRAAGLAGELSERRRAAAGRLGDAITAELASLGMGAARVEVDVGTVAQLGPTGLDRVEFLIATNPGEEPRPLRRVASGGELSRALLALKRVLAGLGPVGTYVFDEVDSGVGGAVAETIGRKLAEVGRFHQVLCITHLPQVAACGTTHLHARKEVARGRTRTLVARLSPEDRVEELARMLGGAEVGEEARGMARALLRANAG